MKNCKCCGVAYSLVNYPIDRRNKDGRTGKCRSCTQLRENKIRDYKTQNTLRIKKGYFKAYQKNKRAKDLNFKLASNLRRRVHHALHGNSKSAHTLTLIGCSIPELKVYLQTKFTTNMTWNNYGKWHIDHVVPCVAFDLTKEGEQEKCFCYTNLQPLWAVDNLKKGAK